MARSTIRSCSVCWVQSPSPHCSEPGAVLAVQAVQRHRRQVHLVTSAPVITSADDLQNCFQFLPTPERLLYGLPPEVLVHLRPYSPSSAGFTMLTILLTSAAGTAPHSTRRAWAYFFSSR